MDDTIALIRKSHSGDKAAREQLVKENVGLVHCVVKRFLERGAEREDLFHRQENVSSVRWGASRQ